MPPTIGTGAQAYTDAFPSQTETQFYLAPQTAQDAEAENNFQALHFTNYTPQRQQGTVDEREFGGSDTLVDPTDAAFDQPTFSGTLEQRLCLNEAVFMLAYAFGAPVTTAGPSAGLFQHVFTSGKNALPYATAIDVNPTAKRTVLGMAMNGLSANIDSTGGTQILTSNFQARDIQMAASASVEAADAPARLFVPKNAFEARIDDVKIGHMLDGTFNYSPNLQAENYVDSVETVGAHYVGDPTLTATLNLRHVSEAQRNSFGGPTPFALEFFAAGPLAGTSFSFKMNRLKAPISLPEPDDRLGRLTLNAAGSKTEGATPLPMITITVINQIENV